MPDGSKSLGVNHWETIGDGVLRLFNCPPWLNGALKIKEKKILKKVEKKC